MVRDTHRGKKWPFLRLAAVPLALVLLASSCPGPGSTTSPRIKMEADHATGFFSLPWPNDVRKTANGTLDITGWPGKSVTAAELASGEMPPGSVFLNDSFSILGAMSKDFGLRTAVYFQAEQNLDPATFPSALGSLEANASVMLMNLDTGERSPVLVEFRPQRDRYRSAKSLIVLPYPGHPLDPASRYAAVVFDTVKTDGAQPLEPAELITSLSDAWDADTGVSEATWLSLREQREPTFGAVEAFTDYSSGDIAAFTVFTTQDPTVTMDAVDAAVDSAPIPELENAVVNPCVGTNSGGFRAIVEGTIKMPRFQKGAFPYVRQGGEIELAQDGSAIVQNQVDVPVDISVPCVNAPQGGWPVATFVNGTGSSGALSEGSLPFTLDSRVVATIPPLYGDLDTSTLPTAQQLEVDLLAGIVGEENIAGILFYNALNPRSARSNLIQQTANHLFLNRFMRSFEVQLFTAGNQVVATTDPARLSAAGHSQGASPMPVVAAYDEDLLAAISSAGAGSYVQLFSHGFNRETLTQLAGPKENLNELSPLIHLIETALEPAEPLNWPSTGHYLAVNGRADEKVPFESSEHTASVIGLDTASVNAVPSVYGTPALDRPVINFPVTGNRNGKTRVNYQTPYHHFALTRTPEVGGIFLSQAEAGLTPTVVPGLIEENAQPSWLCCRLPATLYGEGEG